MDHSPWGLHISVILSSSSPLSAAFGSTRFVVTGCCESIACLSASSSRFSRLTSLSTWWSTCQSIECSINKDDRIKRNLIHVLVRPSPFHASFVWFHTLRYDVVRLVPSGLYIIELGILCAWDVEQDLVRVSWLKGGTEVPVGGAPCPALWYEHLTRVCAQKSQTSSSNSSGPASGNNILGRTSIPATGPSENDRAFNSLSGESKTRCASWTKEQFLGFSVGKRSGFGWKK